MTGPNETLHSQDQHDAFELVLGELETELPQAQTTSMYSVGHPGTCSSGAYCCIAAV